MHTFFELEVELRCGTWAMTAGALQALESLCRAGPQVAGAPQRRPPPTGPQSMAVIPVFGVLEPRPGWLTSLGLGTSCSAIAAQLRAALDDDRVGRIVLAVDSPGGGVFGVQELADELYAARKMKPITASVEGMCGSAAYWLASQAHTLICSSSSEVGSIGVYASHVDESRALEREGLSLSLVHAGRHKIELSPHAPLSDDARAHMQKRVDEHFSAFIGAVARGRGVPPGRVGSHFGQGRMVGAQAALAEKMIDSVGTLHELLTGKPSGSKGKMQARGWHQLQCEIAAVSGPSAQRKRLTAHEVAAAIARVS